VPSINYRKQKASEPTHLEVGKILKGESIRDRADAPAFQMKSVESYLRGLRLFSRLKDQAANARAKSHDSSPCPSIDSGSRRSSAISERGSGIQRLSEPPRKTSRPKKTFAHVLWDVLLASTRLFQSRSLLRLVCTPERSPAVSRTTRRGGETCHCVP
jgi:hypothetical protein